MPALAPARCRAVQPAADLDRDLTRYALCKSRAAGGQSKCGLYEFWVWACVPSSYLWLLLAPRSREAATGVVMAAGTEAGFTRAAGAAAMLVAFGMAAAGERLALRCV